MKRTNRLTEGNILNTLIRFAVPVFFTLFLQALYGGVDLLVVGQGARGSPPMSPASPPEACSCPP